MRLSRLIKKAIRSNRSGRTNPDLPVAVTPTAAQRRSALLLDVIAHPNDLTAAEARVTVPLIKDPLYFRSSTCTAADFKHPDFARWAAILREPLQLQRKLWEFVYIAAHLESAGMLAGNRHGLGFGVGIEPLSAAFAALGAEIVATDAPFEHAQAIGWVDSAQHAATTSALNEKGICPQDEFEDRVSYRVCDMRNIPGTFVDYDFCWSSCALEHLGSIQNGLTFIKSSINCLRPGGIAVHTTEYNISSNDETVDNNDALVLFRRRDIEAVTGELRSAGHHVAHVCFDVVSEPIDLYVDVPPYFTAGSHLKLELFKYVSTSIGLVIQRRDVTT